MDTSNYESPIFRTHAGGPAWPAGRGVARPEEILNDSADKPQQRIADELLNARFELKQLMAQLALRQQVVK